MKKNLCLIVCMFVLSISTAIAADTFFPTNNKSEFKGRSSTMLREKNGYVGSGSLMSGTIQKRAEEVIPIGTVIIWTVTGDPEGWAEGEWLECDGSLIPSLSDYKTLRDLVGSRTPNYQGMFLRGYGSQSHKQENGSTIGVTSTIHKSGDLGVVQGDSVRNVTGGASGSLGYPGYGDDPVGAFTIDNKGHFANWSPPNDIPWGRLQLNISNVTPTANEIRPVNKAVRYLIKAKNVF